MAQVAAHITGTVWKIECKVGQAVNAGDTLVIMPPLSISRQELDWMMDVMIGCTRMVTEGREVSVEVGR